MNIEEISREQISALADGESADRQVAAILAALRDKDAREAWDVYHQIGDVLRSDDMAVGLSAGFAARMAARLEAEPTIVAPSALSNSSAATSLDKDGNNKHRGKRWTMPGIAAAAAMAAIAFVTTPQLMVTTLKGKEVSAVGQHVVAITENTGTGKIVPIASVAGQNAAGASSVSEGEVLRDPRIDDYLLAHQRFSPSIYSTAQYARSITLATDSDK